jgi:hypothetical protein
MSFFTFFITTFNLSCDTFGAAAFKKEQLEAVGIAVACDPAVSHGDNQVYPILVELNLGKYDDAPAREQCRVLVENIECLPPVPRRDKDRLAIDTDTGRQEMVHPLLDRRFWWHDFVYLIAFIDMPRYRQCHDP